MIIVWDSLHAGLYRATTHGVTRKKSKQSQKHIGKLIRENSEIRGAYEHRYLYYRWHHQESH